MKTYIIAKKESKSIFIHLTCFLKQKLNFLYNNRITRLSIDIILLFFSMKNFIFYAIYVFRKAKLSIYVYNV